MHLSVSATKVCLLVGLLDAESLVKPGRTGVGQSDKVVLREGRQRRAWSSNSVWTPSAEEMVGSHSTICPSCNDKVPPFQRLRKAEA